MMTLAYISVTMALYRNKRATAGRKQSSPGRSGYGDARYQNGATRLQVHVDELSSTSTAMSEASPSRRILNDENCNKEVKRSKRLPFRMGGAKEQADADDDKIKVGISNSHPNISGQEKPTGQKAEVLDLVVDILRSLMSQRKWTMGNNDLKLKRLSAVYLLFIETYRNALLMNI